MSTKSPIISQGYSLNTLKDILFNCVQCSFHVLTMVAVYQYNFFQGEYAFVHDSFFTCQTSKRIYVLDITKLHVLQTMFILHKILLNALKLCDVTSCLNCSLLASGIDLHIDFKSRGFFVCCVLKIYFSE